MRAPATPTVSSAVHGPSLGGQRPEIGRQSCGRSGVFATPSAGFGSKERLLSRSSFMDLFGTAPPKTALEAARGAVPKGP
jgi:hypothetical protein